MIDDEVHHTIELNGTGTVDYRLLVGFFARQLLKDLRLVSGYEVLLPKVREFVSRHLFEGDPVDRADPQVLRHLAEPEARKIVFDSFKKTINALGEWCRDATAAGREAAGPEYRFLFVDQAGFERHTPRDLAGLARTFREFQE